MDCFYILVIINTAVNTGMYMSFQANVLFSWGRLSGMELHGEREVLSLAFEKSANHFPKMNQTTLPIGVNEFLVTFVPALFLIQDTLAGLRNQQIKLSFNLLFS